MGLHGGIIIFLTDYFKTGRSSFKRKAVIYGVRYADMRSYNANL